MLFEASPVEVAGGELVLEGVVVLHGLRAVHPEALAVSFHLIMLVKWQ